MMSIIPATPSAVSQMAHFPKYGTVGTLIPNRIFVGGIASDTTENELKHFFSAFGAVKDCKIILDRGGLSKSYGFVTFESQEDADKIIKRMADNLVLRERKLNIGPAIRKQTNARIYGDASVPSASTAMVYPSTTPYALPNGVTLICSPDGYLIPAQPQQPVYQSMMSSYYAQPSYFNSPQGAMSASWTSPTGQWRWASPSNAASVMSPGQYVYPVQMTVLPSEMMYGQAIHGHQGMESGDL